MCEANKSEAGHRKPTGSGGNFSDPSGIQTEQSETYSKDDNDWPHAAREAELIALVDKFPIPSPSISLWRAILIVVVLHVLAITGVFFLHWLKTNSEDPPAPPPEMESSPALHV